MPAQHNFFMINGPSEVCSTVNKSYESESFIFEVYDTLTWPVSTGYIEQFKRMSGRLFGWKLHCAKIVTHSEDKKCKNCPHVEIVAKFHFLKRRNCRIVEIVAHFFAGALRARVEIIFRGNCMRTRITK